MKATTGDKIQLIKEVCYGTAYGLVKVKKDTILNVAKRNSSDDGIQSEEKITLNGDLGENISYIGVWDDQYIITNK